MRIDSVSESCAHRRCLPPISPTDLTTDESICENVRESISGMLKIASTQYDEADVRELQQRPEHFYRRQSELHADGPELRKETIDLVVLVQRREEFQEMINLVLRQVPESSTEAIRHDLGQFRMCDKA